MGTIGTWGYRDFSVSPTLLLTFTDYQRKTAYRTESVENGSAKPGTARIAPELETISFNLLLARSLGVAPQAEADEWRKACEAGEIHPLYIGGVRRGPNLFLVQSVTESKSVFGRDGDLLSCSLAITMQEHVREMERKSESYQSYDSGGGSGGGGGSRTVPNSTKSNSGTSAATKVTPTSGRFATTVAAYKKAQATSNKYKTKK